MAANHIANNIKIIIKPPHKDAINIAFNGIVLNAKIRIINNINCSWPTFTGTNNITI